MDERGNRITLIGTIVSLQAIGSCHEFSSAQLPECQKLSSMMVQDATLD
jgi:hypothetical protein